MRPKLNLVKSMIAGRVLNFAVVYAFHNASFTPTLFSGNLVLAVKCHFHNWEGLRGMECSSSAIPGVGMGPVFPFQEFKGMELVLENSNSLQWSWVEWGIFCLFARLECLR